MAKKKKTRIGICLSGGGARGIAHVGVLQALFERGMAPESVSGASMGAIVGAFYAAGYDPDDIKRLVDDTSLLNLFSFSLPGSGLSELSYLRKLMKRFLPGRFEELERPFAVSVSNLNTGRAEFISEGSLHEAVEASASIPILFKPVKIGDYFYVDGGMLNNLPVEPLLDDCFPVIGVNVNPLQVLPDESWTMLSVGERCFDLIVWQNVQENLRKCDVVIEPPGLSEYNIFAFQKADFFYEAGYEAALRVMPHLRGLLQ